MWKLKDSSKVMGIQQKVNAYKRHLSAMAKIKPGIKVQQPWKPTFSLSKCKNKYEKTYKREIQRQNLTLLEHMTTIAVQDKPFTIIDIPKTIPSNNETFKLFKSRQRRKKDREVMKENQKILSKIKSTASIYNKKGFDKSWLQNSRYKLNIANKGDVRNPDFFELAKQESTRRREGFRKSFYAVEKLKISRPKTALPR